MIHGDDAPYDHDSTHPDVWTEAFEKQRRDWFESSIEIVEYAEYPCPLCRQKIAQVGLDTCALLQIDDGNIGDIRDMNSAFL